MSAEEPQGEIAQQLKGMAEQLHELAQEADEGSRVKIGHMPTPATVAAAFVGVIAYVWVEMILRLIYTYHPNVPMSYSLSGYNVRDGDIEAMWLTMTVVGVIAFLLARLLFKYLGKSHVGKIRTWTWVLLASAIAAPLLGEIGTPWGT